MKTPLISIVIPAYNCGQTIAQTLSGILAQNYSGPMEVIVVDDGSQDNTAQVVQSFPKVKYLWQQNSGPAVARNFGAQNSHGDFVFFTDSDCIPEPGWVNLILKNFGDPKIAVVSGSYDIANPEYLLAECIQKEIEFRHKILMKDQAKVFGSYNFCIRRNVFERVGGFNPGYRQASGEDNDLSYKILQIGQDIFFCRDAKVKHFHTVTILKYLHEQFRHGFWRVRLYIDHPKMTKGDGYTFSKDVIETGVVFGILFCLVLICIGYYWAKMLLAFLVIFMSGLDIFSGIVMIKPAYKGLYFAVVMIARAFARSLGFLMGIFYFSSQLSCQFFHQKILKKPTKKN